MRENWLAIVGSSRKGQNTDTLVDYMIEALNYFEINVKKINLDHKHFSTCSGCEKCLNGDVCDINDSLTEVLNNLPKSDGFIFATPALNYNMTAQMKAFLDRTQKIYQRQSFTTIRRQKAIILGVCKGEDKDQLGYAIKGIEQTLNDINIDIIDEIEYYNTKHFPVNKNGMIKEIIQSRIANNTVIRSEKNVS